MPKLDCLPPSFCSRSKRHKTERIRPVLLSLCSVPFAYGQPSMGVGYLWFYAYLNFDYAKSSEIVGFTLTSKMVVVDIECYGDARVDYSTFHFFGAILKG